MISPIQTKFLLWVRALGFSLSSVGRSKLPRTLLRRVFRHVSTTVQINDFAGNFSMELRLSEHMQRRIFWMGYYNEDLAHLLEATLSPGMTVIDIGANIGEVSLLAAKKVGGEGKVVAFEPIDAIATQLERHVRLNCLHQVMVERCGLGDSIHDSVPIYASAGQNVSDKNDGLGSIYGSREGEAPLQNIHVTTLDAWLSDHPVTRLDLIKIDVEGAEFACLRGATNTLIHFQPKIIIEIQDFSARRAGHKTSDILDFLSSLNYDFQRIEKDGGLTALTPANLTSFQNVLCTPRG